MAINPINPINPINRRYLSVALLTVAALASCRGRHTPSEVKNEEPTSAASKLVSQLKMDDQDTAAQLIQGFYPIEGAAPWRWTAGKFAVVLKSPLGAAEKGATLTLAFSLPDAVIQKTGPVTITALAGEKKLRSQTYKDGGQNFFTADLPPELLGKDSVTVDFVLDKSLAPGTVEKRELGLIASSIGLETK